VRNHAVISIGKIRSPESVQPLIRILVEDESDQVKASAADSLRKIGKPAVNPLIKLVEETKEIELTIRLVQILGKIGDKKSS
jgi:HEAT repeat protein